MAGLSLRKNLFLYQKIFTVNLQKCQSYATPAKNKTFGAVAESIAAKGFLRPHKPYLPPNNAAEIVRSIAGSLHLSRDGDKFTDISQKFKFLATCFEQLKHCVPNSQVHELSTVGDVIAFYETPVDTTVPFDAMKEMDLPENLHVQYDYLRFHPDTDTKFNGKTAFPKSSTLVTGLKYRGKYQGHEAKRSWP